MDSHADETGSSSISKKQELYLSATNMSELISIKRDKSGHLSSTELPRPFETPLMYALATNESTLDVPKDAAELRNWTEVHEAESQGLFPESGSLWPFMLSLLILVVLATILGNLLVLVTIKRNRRLHKPRNYFIFSLAVSDLLLGLFVLPPSAANTLMSTWSGGAIACNVFVGTDVMLCTASIVQLFVISLDRYLAIRHPFIYQRIVLKKRVLWLIASLWLFSALISYLPIFLGWNTASGEVQNVKNPQICFFENTNANYVLFISIGTFFLPLLLMILAYTMILATVREQTKRINEQLLFSSVQNATPENDQSGEPKRASEARAAMMLFVVIATFTVCWFPYFVVFALKAYNVQVNMHVDVVFLWLGYANSMLNPFLYAFCSTEFRYGFLLVLSKDRAATFRRKHPELHNV